jgi:hypothetical protein
MEKICEVSNPELVLKQLKKYYGNDVDLYLSSSKNKKYMVFDEDGKKIHFESLLYQDYTKHKDKKRRENYLKRASNIKGKWKQNPFSPNMLSIILLWDGYDYLVKLKN